MPKSLIYAFSKESALYITRSLKGFLDYFRPQTPGADSNFPDTVIRYDPHLLQVGHYHPLGPIIRMADIIADNPLLSAHNANCHIVTSFFTF
jgi:hypothetical protein